MKCGECGGALVDHECVDCGTRHSGSGGPCCCGRICVGMTVTENRNWNPDCPEHGLGTPWWASLEQVEKRRAQNERLRSLQAQARAARAALDPERRP